MLETTGCRTGLEEQSHPTCDATQESKTQLGIKSQASHSALEFQWFGRILENVCKLDQTLLGAFVGAEADNIHQLPAY
jgi:hypothetical protein